MNRSKFTELALSYLDELTAFATHLTDTEWEAEDLVQTTYENAFSRWESLEEPGACRAWLFQILRNRWYDELRSRRAAPQLELVDPKDPSSPRAPVRPTHLEEITTEQL